MMPASINYIGNKCLIVQGTNYFAFKLNLLVSRSTLNFNFQNKSNLTKKPFVSMNNTTV